MYKLLKIVVPAIQVIAIMVAFWPKHFISGKYYSEVEWAQQLLISINFPLLLVAGIVGAIVGLVANDLPTLRALLADKGIVGISLLGAIAFFWFLVISEVERRRGKSSFAFSGRRVSRIASGIYYFMTGLAAFAYSGYLLYDSWKFLEAHRGANALRGLPIEFLFRGGLILLVWGTLLVRVSVVDLIRHVRSDRTLAGGPS